MLRKTDVTELRIGMYVAELDRPWVESPFLFQGFTIESDEDLAKLRETCRYVYVDDMKSPQLADNRLVSRAPTTGRASTTVLSGANQVDRKAFTTDIKRVEQARSKAGGNVTRVLGDVRLGKSVDTEESKAVVETLVDNISHNPNSMLWLTNLRQKHERTATHCLNTSIVAVAFGQHLGMKDDELNLLGLGAMLHDVGHVRIPPLLLNKPGALSEDERLVVRKHAADGHAVLKISRQLPDEALDVVRCHHERVDGRGYPGRLRHHDQRQHLPPGDDAGGRASCVAHPGSGRIWPRPGTGVHPLPGHLPGGQRGAAQLRGGRDGDLLEHDLASQACGDADSR